MAEEGAPVENVSPSPSAPSGRRGILIGVAAVVILGIFVVIPRSSQKGDAAKPGDVVSGDLTLIVSDRTEVSCVASDVFDHYGCGFMGDTTPRKIDEREMLRPYMTTDRRVYLIPGLFLQPDIARRAATESPTVPRDQLKRFTAKCHFKKAGEMRGFKLRWAENGAWSEPQSADVVTVVDCKVTG